MRLLLIQIKLLKSIVKFPKNKMNCRIFNIKKNFYASSLHGFKSGIVELRCVFEVSLPLHFTGKNHFYINTAIGGGDRRFCWFCYFALTHE